MEKNDKKNAEKVITVRIRNDQFWALKGLKVNISKFVREKIDDEFTDLESVLQRITNLKNELNVLQKLHNSVLQRNTELNTINKERGTFLKETKELIKEHPEFLEGRIKLYKNTFGIVGRVTKEEFMEILDKIK